MTRGIIHKLPVLPHEEYPHKKKNYRPFVHKAWSLITQIFIFSNSYTCPLINYCFLFCFCCDNSLTIRCHSLCQKCPSPKRYQIYMFDHDPRISSVIIVGNTSSSLTALTKTYATKIGPDQNGAIIIFLCQRNNGNHECLVLSSRLITPYFLSVAQLLFTSDTKCQEDKNGPHNPPTGFPMKLPEPKSGLRMVPLPKLPLHLFL